jgi:putative glycerol kinase 5
MSHLNVNEGQHVSDVSSASASGLFDPFTMQWAGWAQSLFKLPATMFPRVVDTAGDFGSVPASLFGAEIPITCSMADQAASLFGSGCFEPGDLKLTMGTGSFINVNTGTEPHASITGNSPFIYCLYCNIVNCIKFPKQLTPRPTI